MGEGYLSVQNEEEEDRKWMKERANKNLDMKNYNIKAGHKYKRRKHMCKKE